MYVMAKRGGVSDINGFVSVKTEEKKSMKNVSKDTSSTRQKTNSTSSTGKSVVKAGSKATVIADDGSKSKTVISKRDSSREALKNKSSDKNANNVSVSKTSKPADPSKARRSTDTGAKPQIKTSRKESNVLPVSRQTVNTKVKPEIKSTSNVTPKKEAKTKSEVPSLDRKVQSLKQSSSSTKVISSDKKVLKKTTEPSSKTTSLKKPVNNITKKVVEAKPNSSPKSKSTIVTSNRKSPSFREKEVNSVKITSQEKTSVTLGELSSSLQSKQSSDEIKIASKYKDVIYFEVDMGNKKDSNGKSSKTKEITQAIPPPPPMSRQGTFTKDDEDSKNDSLNLPNVSSLEKTENDNDTSQADGGDNDEEYEYEDDFEDYESDFEEYISESGVSSETESETSKKNSSGHSAAVELKRNTPKPGEKTVEEEKKLDSGNYDLTTKLVLPQSVKQKQLDQIKEAITRENSLYSEREKLVPAPVTTKNEFVFLDFLGALKRQDAEKVKKEQKTRSSLILDMITLHEQQISIYEAQFVHIEDFDQIYRNRNVVHVFTEVSVLMRDEEMQTIDIKVNDKWTQFPTSYHSWSGSENPLEVYIEDHRGFGGDSVKVDTTAWFNPYYNPEKLYNFVDSAGQVILIMLEEEERWRSNGNITVTKAKHDHGFSRGYIPIQTKSLHFLKNRPICDITFSPHNQHVFLSSHRFVKDIENLSSFEDQFLGRSILCLWNILEPSQPLSMFVASCQASTISFDIVHVNVLYAGLTDGSICLWDTTERSLYHKETMAGTLDYLLRTPTYCTAHLWGDDYHNNVIVAIQSLGYEGSENRALGKFSPTQVVTLDADGKVIVWVTVSTSSYIESDIIVEKQDLGLAFWGNLKLVPSRTLTPVDNLPASQNNWGLLFLCMSLVPQTTRSVLIGTNIGSVVHCPISGEKPSVPVYVDREETDCMVSIVSLEKSPHQFPVFLAGCSNGTVRIHLLERKRPIKILMLENQVRTPITKIRWSLLGAGLFFILDKSLSLHIWDLCKDETSPILSLSLKKLKATHFDISCDNKFVYMALVVHRDKLEIHRLKEQFIPKESFEKNKEIFTKFIDKSCY